MLLQKGAGSSERTAQFRSEIEPAQNVYPFLIPCFFLRLSMPWPPYFCGAPHGVLIQDHSESLTGVRGVNLPSGKGRRSWFSSHCSCAFTPSPWVDGEGQYSTFPWGLYTTQLLIQSCCDPWFWLQGVNRTTMEALGFLGLRDYLSLNPGSAVYSHFCTLFSL